MKKWFMKYALLEQNSKKKVSFEKDDQKISQNNSKR